MSKTEKGKIVKEGMGGFLCPPGHPMHEYSVQTDLRRRPENRTSMSLDYATESPMLDADTRAAARTLLATWEVNKPPLKSAAVKNWIRQVLGYFKGCFNFQPENESGWHAGNLTIDSDVDPLEHADCHAGVHLIRKYYPDYQPARLDFLRAYWGTKPGKKEKA
jgi:hypothetical protein